MIPYYRFLWHVGEHSFSPCSPMMLRDTQEAWIPVEDQYSCTNRYCEDYVDGNGLAVGTCNRSHTTVPNEQPGSLWNGEIAPLANMTINGVIWCEYPRWCVACCASARSRS